VEAERWHRIEQIYNKAVACDARQRAAVLEQSCGNDDSLRTEVESLLNYSQRDEPALEKPALELLAEELAGDLSRQPTPAEKMIGTRIGQYKIVGKLGGGGMGDVYRAVRADEAYEQHVALKLLRDLLQDQDASFFLTQFRNERQILANLQHPNIARLFDGGATEDGIPYFVMELVEGQPINEYCDQHRLSISERLRLFLQIASAVQYAHQRLIVHRDIKPANILVKADGVPVLLDFGIAKIIDPTAQAATAPATRTGMRMMTPEYACPEQIRGEAVTTATDVYSLGVVLYELLSGHRPYRTTTMNPLEIARVICEEEPKKPSTAVTYPAPDTENNGPVQIGAARRTEVPRLARQLRGDLDAVLLKTLRKEPEQRYATAGELADDIQRYLEGRPVVARRGTGMYRARKFVTRHRAAVAATAICCILAIVGVLSILRAEHTARVEQARAEQRFNDVRALANSLLFEIHDAIRDLPGSTGARKLLVDRALKYLDSLARESSGDIGLQRELAAAYERVGAVQGDPLYANLGDTTGAIESYRKALAMRQAIAAASDKSNDQLALTDISMAVGNALVSTGDVQGALSVLEEAEPIARRLALGHPDDPELQENDAGMSFALARAYAGTGDWAQSAAYYRNSAAIREKVTSGPPQFLLVVRTKLAGAYGYLSGVEYHLGHQDQAIQLQAKAGQILSNLLATDANNATLRGFLFQSEYWLGYYLSKKGKPTEALNHYKVAFAGYQKLTSEDPKDAFARRSLASCYMSMGIALAANGKTAEGLESARRGNEIFEALAAGGGSGGFYKLVGVAESRASLAGIYEQRADLPNQSGSVRQESWRNARLWYARSLDAWSRAKEKGTLDQSDQGEPDRIAKEIAKCDAALSRSAILHSNLRN
jgi:eukaryotic-like serine/threonine-protein kinase